MRFLRILCTIIAANQLTVVGQPVFAQVADSSANVRAVMRAEQAWWGGEIARYDTHDTPDGAELRILYPGQGAADRGELLAMIRPDTAGEHEELSNWRIRDYGSTVVATADYRITQDGKDFVLVQDRKIVPVEVKCASSVGREDGRHLSLFLERHPEAVIAVVLSSDPEIRWVRERVLAAPWWSVL